MAYNRRYRKRRYRKKPWYKRKYSAQEMAGKALSGVMKLKKLVNVEIKKADIPVASTTIANTGTSLAAPANITEGATNELREGNSILTQSLVLNYKLRLHTSAVTTAVRMVVVKDLQQIADTTPSWTDIYQEADPLTFINKETAGRFNILYDQCHVMSTNAQEIVLRKNFIPLNFHVKYNGPLSSDIQKHGIYLLAISDQGTNVPNLDYSTRLNFTDN